MITNTKLDKNNEMKIRRELLVDILDCIPDKHIFEKALDFYRQIIRQNPDLIISMSRKSWCVIHLFLPLLEEEGIFVDSKKLTHDRMVHPWFAELDQDKLAKIKVYVVDDTFQTGRALDKCVRRLKWVYKIDEKNITVAVFAMAEDRPNFNKRVDIEVKRYTVYPTGNKSSFKVNWGGGNLHPKDDVSAISYSFVEALHACSVPYVGYIPAFRLPLEDVQNFLGAERGKEVDFGGESAIRVPGYLEQDDLRAPLNDPAIVGYYNITNQQMRQQDVEAFYFSLPEDVDAFNSLLPAFDSGGKNDMPFLPPKHAFSIAALRFYLNRKTGVALIVPYLSLKDCRADAEIAHMFPKELQPLMREMCSTQEWDDYEGRLTAYRLLRFAACYLWGKYIFKHWFGREVKEENIVSRGGICSEKFFTWLNSPSVEQDLTHIWSFFDPEKKNIIEENPEQVNLENIVHDYMPADEIGYKDVIINSLLESVSVDYFITISMMFRNIYERDRELLYKNKKNSDDVNFSLVEPFHGFPMHAFFALLLLKFPNLKTRRDVLTTVTLMLCDMGIAVTQLCQRGKIIGTVLFNGEQSCHALAPVAPEYAHFLSELPEILHNFNREERQEKIRIAKNKIKNYFEEEKSQGVVRRLPLEYLMKPLENVEKIILDDPERKVDAYSTLPRGSFFDRSELFFLKLREELSA